VKRVSLSAAQVEAVRAGKWVRVDLGFWTEVGENLLRTRSALVGRAAGATHAWANVCLHQPTALDVTADLVEHAPGVRAAPMDDDRVHLMCHSHGALYRVADGLCLQGPCEGQELVAIDVEDDGVSIVLRIPPEP
jgi:nitrite reductase/ring-hydroxylating ferredoxin subunit